MNSGLTIPPLTDDPAAGNIAAHLPALARRFPEQLAILCPLSRGERFAEVTYARLDAESDDVARGLASIGITPGMRTVLMVPPGVEFFTLVFALFKAGATLVCVDPGIGMRRLTECLADAAPTAFVGVPKAHWARRVLRWAHATNRINVVVSRRSWMPTLGHSLTSIRRRGESLRSGGGELPWVSTRLSDPAAILFTSGSTGPPKGAAYTHGNFQAQVAALRAAYDIQPGEIDLATFPLFALFAPALGMTAVVPRMDFTRPARVDPREIIGPVRRFGVTNLFGSPALLDRVGQYAAEHEVRLPSLRRVVSAGAPVPAKVIERFVPVLARPAQVFTPYGATESLPVASIGSDEILRETRHATDRGEGVCIGRPVPPAIVKIIRIDDGLITEWSDSLAMPPGEVGEIAVQSPATTASYFNRPDHTALAKIVELTSIDDGVPVRFWHRMGDLGYFDAAGRLWFCGRKSQRVRTVNGDLLTICCEAIFNTHSLVRRSALVGVPDGTVQRPVICIEPIRKLPRAEEELARRELLDLAARHIPTRSIRDILFHRAFPVDIRHNSKIGREQLAIWAARQLQLRKRG